MSLVNPSATSRDPGVESEQGAKADLASGLKKIEADLVWTTRGTLISALLNARAFASQAASSSCAVAGAVIGLALPALVYRLTRVSATIWRRA